VLCLVEVLQYQKKKKKCICSKMWWNMDIYSAVALCECDSVRHILICKISSSRKGKVINS
jgi:hypothetical protein